MKTRTSLLVSLMAAGLCFGVSVSQAQLVFLYAAEAKTVSLDLGSAAASTLETRLFSDSAFNTPAPLGTAIWFVADINHDGVPAEALGSSQVPLASVLGADDRLLFQDVLDGDQPGSVAGRYRELSISLSGAAADEAALENANIYVFLWNSSGDTFTPTAGSTFGILNTGINPPPTTLGNAFWAIDQNISATQFTVVPESELWCSVFASLLLAFGLAHRVRRSVT